VKTDGKPEYEYAAQQSIHHQTAESLLPPQRPPHPDEQQQPNSPKKRKAATSLSFQRGESSISMVTSGSGDNNNSHLGEFSEEEGKLGVAVHHKHRGPIGQLLHQFGQIELNRDLLEAIKRSESHTAGAKVGGQEQHQLKWVEDDRVGFDAAVCAARRVFANTLDEIEIEIEAKGEGVCPGTDDGGGGRGGGRTSGGGTASGNGTAGAVHGECRTGAGALVQAYALHIISLFAQEGERERERETQRKFFSRGSAQFSSHRSCPAASLYDKTKRKKEKLSY